MEATSRQSRKLKDLNMMLLHTLSFYYEKVHPRDHHYKRLLKYEFQIAYENFYVA